MSKTDKTDLDITNYELHDILLLFDIPSNFSERDLKYAKSVVLKTHPDKSGLDPDYFRFYSAAYKTLFSIWEFRKKGDVKSDSIQNVEYLSTSEDNDKKVLLDNFFKTNKQLDDKKKFNDWFNEEFDKNKISSENEQKGYEEWFRGNDVNESNDNGVTITMANMGEEFEKRKTKARTVSLIKHHDIQELSLNNSISASELSSDAPSSFDSDLFSNLGFQDLQKAYTETVIPITHEDYELKTKFKNIDEYVKFRGTQNMNPLLEQQAIEFLKNKEKKSDEVAVKRAYELAKQTELAQQKNNIFWSNLQRIH
jgi:hypothetical protein